MSVSIKLGSLALALIAAHTHTSTPHASTPHASTPANPLLAQSKKGEKSEKKSTVVDEKTLDDVIVEDRKTHDITEQSIKNNRKTARELRDIPQSVSVVPASVIETQGATSLGDALKNVSGLTLASGEGGFTGDSISIRGFSSRSDMYRNGTKDNGMFFRDTFNIEQAEVYKGASSMLFGRGGTGGVINTVTKKADGISRSNAALTQSSLGGYRLTADLSSDKHTLANWRINLLSHDQDSFRDKVFVERKGLSSSFQSQLTNTTTLDLEFFYQDEDSVLDYGIPFNEATGKPADVPRESHYGLGKDSFQRYDTDITTITLSHSFNDALSFVNTTTSGNYDRMYRMVRPYRIDTLTPDETTQVRRNHSFRGSEQFNIQNQSDWVYLLKTDSAEHRIVTGFEWNKENYVFKNLANVPSLPDIPLLDPYSVATPDGIPNSLNGELSRKTDTKARTKAIYFSDQIQWNEHWQTVMGVRYDEFDAESIDAINQTQLRKKDTFLSKRLGLIYQPSDVRSFYFSYGTSFNPSAESLSLRERSVNLDPESNTNLEIGSKVDLLDGAVSLNIAAYQLTKTNARTADPSNTSIQVLDGEQESKGIEIEWTALIDDSFQLRAGLSRQRSEITRSNDVRGGIPIQGKAPRNTPEKTANVWMIYSLNDKTEFGVGSQYIGSRFVNSENTFELASYTRWDAYLGWKWSSVTLAVNLYNLTDKEYYEHAHPVFATPGASRSVAFTFRKSFE